MLFRAAISAALVASAAAHGAVTFPRPRNALDGDLPIWKEWNYPCRDGQRGSSCSVKFCSRPPNATQDPNTFVGTCPVPAYNGLENYLNGSGGQVSFRIFKATPSRTVVPLLLPVLTLAVAVASRGNRRAIGSPTDALWAATNATALRITSATARRPSCTRA